MTNSRWCSSGLDFARKVLEIEPAAIVVIAT
jgi:hypothetical protein